MPNEYICDSTSPILDEMNVWLPILSEHLKFQRGGLDPSIKQDPIFRNLDFAARQMDFLVNMMFAKGSPGPEMSDPAAVVLPQAIAVRDMKVFLYEGIKCCEILSILSPDLTDHMRRETDRFIGIIGGPRPTRRDLGIPGGDKLVLCVPRMLIAELPDKEKFTVLVEEIMFFSRINEEHAHQIAMTAKPELQEKITKKAKEFEKKFKENMEKAKSVEERNKGLHRLIEETLQLMNDFKDFGMQLNKSAQSCSLPGGQTNSWPLLDDHVLREGQYFIELLKMSDKK